MNWGAIGLELGICAIIFILLISEILAGRAEKRAIPFRIAIGGLIFLSALLIWQQSAPPLGSHQASQGIWAQAGRMWTADKASFFFKWLFLFTLTAVLFMVRALWHRLRGRLGALTILLFCALLGMCTLASAKDLVLMFVGLEVLSFSLYVMSAYITNSSGSIEAGMKYLIAGSIASGTMVYGIALIYGQLGSTSFNSLGRLFSAAGAPALSVAGLVLVLAGIGFKVAAVPFQWWVPDVYEGAPIPVAALLSVGSKMAGVMVLMRLLHGSLSQASGYWSVCIAVVSAATMCYGNLAAIPQTNIKRLLGYSSIGHAGYLLMGIAAPTFAGAKSVGYYLIAYMVSNLAVFFVVALSSEQLGSEELSEYNGLARRSPLLAAGMLIGLLSLAGVPPLAGFAGKFFVLLASVQIRRLWLVAIGAANVAVSLYYYMMVVRRMYVIAPSNNAPIKVDATSRAMLWLLIACILLVGIVQAPFVRFAGSGVLL